MLKVGTQTVKFPPLVPASAQTLVKNINQCQLHLSPFAWAAQEFYQRFGNVKDPGVGPRFSYSWKALFLVIAPKAHTASP